MKILLLIIASLAFADGLGEKIEAKLNAKDYPTGDPATEFKNDKKPHLAELMTEASSNKKKALLPTVSKILKNKNIFWEVRQEVVYFVCYFKEDPKALNLLKQVVIDPKEFIELQENAYACISTSKVPDAKKMEIADSILKRKGLDVSLKLMIAKDLSGWGNKEKAKKVLDEVLSTKDLEIGPRTRAKELRDEIN